MPPFGEQFLKKELSTLMLLVHYKTRKSNVSHSIEWEHNIEIFQKCKESKFIECRTKGGAI